MKKIIEVENLIKTYKNLKGTKAAVNKVTFSIMEGEVFGILGPNGAGKTTLIKILTTLLLPTSGTAKVLGYDVKTNSASIRKHINFVYGGERGVYGRLTSKEYMHYFCTLYKIPKIQHESIITNLLNIVGLIDQENQKIQTFSKGMIQRLHIARCLINDPKILFLDEPTIGLDPIGGQILRNLVKELSKRGITIILTTHYMQEADELCDRIAFIKNGEISLIGETKEIKENCNKLNLYEALMSVNNLDELYNNKNFKNLEVEEIKSPFYTIQFDTTREDLNIDELRELLLQYGEVLKLSKKEISLEDAYLNHMKEVG